MYKKLSVLIAISVAVALLFSGAAFAEDESSASGTVTSKTLNSITFSVKGKAITLSINEETEIIGEAKEGTAVYVEWKGDTALYIEVEESITDDDKE